MLDYADMHRPHIPSSPLQTRGDRTPVDKSRQIGTATFDSLAGTTLPLVRPTFSLRQNVIDDFPMHIRQTKIAACMMEGEAFVVETQTVQDRRLQVMDVDRIFGDVESEVVGGSERHAGFDAAAS